MIDEKGYLRCKNCGAALGRDLAGQVDIVCRHYISKEKGRCGTFNRFIFYPDTTAGTLCHSNVSKVVFLLSENQRQPT